MIRIWDTATNKVVKNFSGHTQAVTVCCRQRVFCAVVSLFLSVLFVFVCVPTWLMFFVLFTYLVVRVFPSATAPMIYIRAATIGSLKCGIAVIWPTSKHSALTFDIAYIETLLSTFGMGFAIYTSFVMQTFLFRNSI